MAQKGFGRRNVPSPSGAARPAAAMAAAPSANAGDLLGTSSSSSTGRSVAVMAGVVVVVTVAAGGLAYALNAAGANGSGRSTVATASAHNSCDPNKDKCVNQYQVALTCNGEQQQKSVSVNAETAGEAEARAERYNRGCRSRGSAFVAAVLIGAARSYHGGSRAGETRVADAPASKSRRTLRFRRR